MELLNKFSKHYSEYHSVALLTQSLIELNISILKVKFDL